MKIHRFNAVALALVMLGCGASAKGLGDRINRTPLNAQQAAQHKQLVEEGDTLWGHRTERPKLEAAIAKWEQAVRIKDDDWQTYEKLARACYLLADGMLVYEQGTPEGKANFLATHEKGYYFAQRGMAAISRDFEKRMMAGTQIEHAAKVLGRNGVPLIYWYASNLGKWGKAKGFTTILEYKDRAFDLISRVRELNPDFFYGAADRYFGTYYAVAPSFAGGDVQKSYEHFQASLKAAPNYLGTYVLAAENYAVKQTVEGGSELFDQFLNAVINARPCEEPEATEPCIMKELAPEAEIEKRKARDLLSRKDELF
jgi:tetratricopeptide (TPR) repeat protein